MRMNAHLARTALLALAVVVAWGAVSAPGSSQTQGAGAEAAEPPRSLLTAPVFLDAEPP